MNDPISAVAAEAAGVQDHASRRFLAGVVALAFVMNTVGRGVTETFAVFLLPVQNGLVATRSEITATYAIFAMCYAAAAPFAGQLIDRLGARVTYGLGLLILGIGYFAAGAATTPWHYYLAAGLGGGLGSCMLGMIVASSLLSRWFTRRIGSIVSLPYAAIGAGMLIVPPLTQILLDAYGWRTAHRIIGSATLALLPILFLLPLRRISSGSEEWQQARHAAKSSPTGGWNVRAALKTRAFWGLFSAYFWTSVAAYAVLPQSVAYLVEQGFNPLLAASAFGMTGMLSAIGIIAIGWLSDRVGRLPAVTLSYIITICGIACLLAISVHPSILLLYGFVLLFGLMQGARGPIIVATISTLFRGGAIGGIFGTLSIGMGLGQAFGSFVSALLQQWTGSYRSSFIMAMSGSALGLTMFWTVRALRRQEAPQLPARA